MPQNFTEANSVEYFVRDLLKGVGWEYLPSESLQRSTSDVLVEEHLRDALIRLNPEISKKPDRADEVIYKLRAIILTVQTDGFFGQTKNLHPGYAVSAACLLDSIMSMCR